MFPLSGFAGYGLEALQYPVTGSYGTADDEYGVVPPDCAEHIGPALAIQRGRDRLRAARYQPQNQHFAHCVNSEEKLRQESVQSCPTLFDAAVGDTISRSFGRGDSCDPQLTQIPGKRGLSHIPPALKHQLPEILLTADHPSVDDFEYCRVSFALVRHAFRIALLRLQGDPQLMHKLPRAALTKGEKMIKYSVRLNSYGEIVTRTIALAYSGGLDTSIIVPWLKENYNARVICVAAEIGQGDELEGVRAKAIASGAEECYIEDLRKEFVEDFIWPTLRAGAIYGRKYLLGTSMGRPLIARRQVEVARQVGADALAHGCTGKGNDQVRFELTYAAFAPELPIIAPWREWNIRSREDAISYAEAHHVPITATREKIYSRDRNIWHISHEGGILEDPAAPPPADLFMLTDDPASAPRKGEDVTIGFESGTPVSVNGSRMDSVSLLMELNRIGGRNGVGRIDLVEDRLVGMKSRGVYETPGGTLLYAAHSELEQLVLDRRTLAAKDMIAPHYADLVYEGRWWTTEREAYDSFVDVTQERVTGSVTLHLQQGALSIVGRTSDYALYDERFVTFGEDDVYEQSDAAGFIRLYALPSRVRALRDRELAARTAAAKSVAKSQTLSSV